MKDPSIAPCRATLGAVGLALACFAMSLAVTVLTVAGSAPTATLAGAVAALTMAGLALLAGLMLAVAALVVAARTAGPALAVAALTVARSAPAAGLAPVSVVFGAAAVPTQFAEKASTASAKVSLGNEIILLFLSTYGCSDDGETHLFHLITSSYFSKLSEVCSVAYTDDVPGRLEGLHGKLHPEQVSYINLAPGDSGARLFRTNDGAVVGVVTKLVQRVNMLSRMILPQEALSEPVSLLNELIQSN